MQLLQSSSFTQSAESVGTCPLLRVIQFGRQFMQSQCVMPPGVIGARSQQGWGAGQGAFTVSAGFEGWYAQHRPGRPEVCKARTRVSVQPSLQEVQRSAACQTAAAAAGTMLGTRCAYTVQLRGQGVVRQAYSKPTDLQPVGTP